MIRTCTQDSDSGSTGTALLAARISTVALTPSPALLLVVVEYGESLLVQCEQLLHADLGRQELSSLR